MLQNDFLKNEKMKKINQYLILLLILGCLQKGHAQEHDNILPKGNQDFESKNFVDAEANYRISESKFAKKSSASYNLGNAIYRSNMPEEASIAYKNAIKNAKTHPEKQQAFHNIGNSYMQKKDYTNAVQAYKNALIQNPADEETRYNFALAKKMLKDNPPKKDDKKKDDKKKDDKKDQKKDDKKEDKKDDPKKEGDKPKDNKPKPQQGGISKERLENLLDAVNNEEKKVQEKMNKTKEKGRPIQSEKDW